MMASSHQDVAWARHVIVVEFADAEPEVMRLHLCSAAHYPGLMQVHSASARWRRAGGSHAELHRRAHLGLDPFDGLAQEREARAHQLIGAGPE
jgi:hypothetical protein